MNISEIPNFSLTECLKFVEEQFDVQSLTHKTIDQASVLDYYHHSDRGYRLFHSKEGAIHVGLNGEGKFPDEDTTKIHLGQVDLINERLDRNAARRVLEIGCGVGFNTRNLASRLNDSQFVGIDLSDDHIKRACREAKHLTNLEFEGGNYQQLRFEDATFDTVFAVECLCQSSDMQAALQEAFRVLRPGGRLIVIDCFRADKLDTYDHDLQLAIQLVEKSTAVNKFALLDSWWKDAQAIGFSPIEQLDLTSQTSDSLSRLYHLSQRFFKMPQPARALLKVFPQRLLENSICGLLMPFTVGSGAHLYYLCELERG